MATSVPTKATVEERRRQPRLNVDGISSRIADVDCRTEWKMEDGGESETTVTTAVSTGTDRATLSLTVIPELSQHTRFSNNND